MRIILLNLIILLFFVGCSNVRQNKDIKNSLNKIDYNTTYAERDKNKDFFLFMDFWSFMSKQDFFVIRDSLVKTNNLSINVLEMDTTFLYTMKINISPSLNEPFIQDYIFELTPTFSSDRLISISLKNKNEVYIDPTINIYWRNFYSFNILELYKTKYGKPKTINDPVSGKKNGYVWIFKNRVIEFPLPYIEIKNGQNSVMVDINYLNLEAYNEKLFQEKERIDETKKEANRHKAKTLKDI